MSSKPAGQFVDSHLPAQGLKPFCFFVWCFGRLQLLSISARPFGHDQVVAVVISVTADMSPAGDLHVTAIFLWGDVALSLLRRSYVLPWPGTVPGAAHPTTLGSTIHRRLSAWARCDANPYGDGF